MEQIKILVPEEPIPAARPRFAAGHAYQPKRNRDFRAVVQQVARAMMSEREPLKGELSVFLKLYRKYRTCTRIFGDVDNHAKAILDALNGICYVDDSQIARCVIEKHTDKEFPRAEIELVEMMRC